AWVVRSPERRGAGALAALGRRKMCRPNVSHRGGGLLSHRTVNRKEESVAKGLQHGKRGKGGTSLNYFEGRYLGQRNPCRRDWPITCSSLTCSGQAASSRCQQRASEQEMPYGGCNELGME